MITLTEFTNSAWSLFHWWSAANWINSAVSSPTRGLNCPTNFLTVTLVFHSFPFKTVIQTNHRLTSKARVYLVTYWYCFLFSRRTPTGAKRIYLPAVVTRVWVGRRLSLPWPSLSDKLICKWTKRILIIKCHQNYSQCQLFVNIDLRDISQQFVGRRKI